jgi:nitrous oxide reductase
MRHISGATATILMAVCGLVMLATTAGRAAQTHEDQAGKTFTIVAVDVDSVPFWLPSVAEVYQGDHVRLILKNMMGGAPDIHGFAIPAYHVSVLIPHGATKTVDFTADKAGIFPFICQIHADHIGGQLIVHSRKDDAQGR